MPKNYKTLPNLVTLIVPLNQTCIQTGAVASSNKVAISSEQNYQT